jgi:hypothetical protein
VWAFVLEPDRSGTRLVSRNRITSPGTSPVGRLVFRYLMEPGSLVMERKMLLGIKQRAERLEATATGAAQGGSGETEPSRQPADQ